MVLALLPCLREELRLEGRPPVAGPQGSKAPVACEASPLLDLPTEAAEEEEAEGSLVEGLSVEEAESEALECPTREGHRRWASHEEPSWMDCKEAPS